MENGLKTLFTIIFLCNPLSTLAQGDIPDVTDKQELVSLIFVFDTTGSMRPELRQVKSGALKILQQLSQNEQKIIGDYIFVPFHDPSFGPARKTTNATAFERVLEEVEVRKGGDCPEMSLSGIQLGLQEGSANSFLFVFTDDAPKDSQVLAQVLDEITAKHTRVFFILTEATDVRCRRRSVAKEYEEIADKSGGQIFDIAKEDITKVLDFIKLIVKPRPAELVAVDDRGSRTKRDVKYEVPVDETMRELVLSLVTKDDTVLRVTKPSGQRFDNFSFCNESAIVKVTRMCSVKNPQVGNWNLSVQAVTDLSLRVSAVTNITFDFGFQIFPDNQTTAANRVLCQPINGTENTFFIKLNDTSKIGSLTTGEIMSLEGRPVKSFPLKRVDEKDDLYYGSFVPTNKTYHLRISGETKQGLKFQRITSIAFSSFSNNTNCTVQKMDYVPKEKLTNSSSALRFTCWLLAILLGTFQIVGLSG